MKKMLILLLASLLTILPFFIRADDDTVPGWYSISALHDIRYTPLQLGIMPGMQVFDIGTANCGVSVFMLGSFAYHTSNFGIQTAPLFTFVTANYGLETALISACSENDGVNIGLFGGEGENNGLALSFFNYSDYRNSGLQLSFINQSYSWWENYGGQIGVFNIADSGWQFGLLNYNRGAAIKVLPLFNFFQTKYTSRKVDPKRLALIRPDDAE